MGIVAKNLTFFFSMVVIMTEKTAANKQNNLNEWNYFAFQ